MLTVKLYLFVMQCRPAPFNVDEKEVDTAAHKSLPDTQFPVCSKARRARFRELLIKTKFSGKLLVNFYCPFVERCATFSDYTI